MRHLIFPILLLSLTATAGEKPLMRDFIGLNGHTVQFKPELYQPVARWVRDYHPIDWDLGKDTSSVPPFPFAANRVHWETVYGSWKKAGWRVHASLLFDNLPRAAWKDLATDSRAYGERFAKAFGPSSALPLVESVEIGNEPGKYSDDDYRILLEQMGRGLRAGDAKLKIATCNLTTDGSHDYAKSVKCLEGLEACYDLLNIHTYAQLEGWPTWRRSFPEDPRLKDYLPDVERLCAWRDLNAPEKPVWITEFGYDSTTKKADPDSEFKQWEGVSDEDQALWIVRSWLLFSALPVEKAFLYFFNDRDEAKVHASSGLTRDFKPKASFHAAAHFSALLGDFRFDRIVRQEEGGPHLYAYLSEDGKTEAWVAWLGAESGEREEAVTFPGAPRRVVSLKLSAGDPADETPPGSAAQLRFSTCPKLYFFPRE